jgi:hypothetical protein
LPLFRSNVCFSFKQLEQMHYEIGEILGKLKEKEVFDLKYTVPIILIDRSKNYVDFHKTKILEVKRFISLVRNHLDVLTYLSRNLSFENVTQDTTRKDRIMGAINYGKTSKYRQRNLIDSSIVFCYEVSRSYDTPENRILVMILFAILTYCDRYLKLKEKLIETSNMRFDPTIEELQKIRSYISNLLSKIKIKQILLYSMDPAYSLDILFTKMYDRINQGKIPVYYIKILNLFYKWRHYIFVSSKIEEVAKDVLQYNFLSLTNTNDLYECWIFCKILYAISQIHSLKFKEINSSKGLVDFKATDGLFHILYQPRFQTEWIDQERHIEDRPDIVIEFKNGINIIIDAKNSFYKTKKPTPYLYQMRSYMKTINARYGIFFHSESEDPNLWREIYNKTTHQKIMWTSAIPGSLNDATANNMSKAVALFNDI